MRQARSTAVICRVHESGRLKVLPSIFAEQRQASATGDAGQTERLSLPPAIVSRAVELAHVGFMVAEPQMAEPLVYVNRAFEEITGYQAADVIGKNCRYLQGSDRLQPEVAQMRAAISARAEVSVRLRNYRKDGHPSGRIRRPG